MSTSTTPLRSDVGAPQTTAGDRVHNIANGSSGSKVPEGESSTGGFQAQNKMTVQPPKQDDLQQSYATVVRTDVDYKGWYGGMSKSFSFLFLAFSLALCSILCHASYSR
jgi:erythrocyte band 7 integral membrane protein